MINLICNSSGKGNKKLSNFDSMFNFKMLNGKELFIGESQSHLNPNESISILARCGNEQLITTDFSRIVGHGRDIKKQSIILAVTDCTYGGYTMFKKKTKGQNAHSWICLDTMSSMYISVRTCDNA